MSAKLSIRKTKTDDVSALQSLYQMAFTDEDLFPLVTELMQDGENTLLLSAITNERLVGHIVFTRCHASPPDVPLALLGPMAVLPDQQKQGIGSRLIQEGITILREQAVVKLLVLGDPNYYGRSGFTAEPHISTPYSIPEEWKPAWQSLALVQDAAFPSSTLHVPPAWQQPALWSE